MSTLFGSLYGLLNPLALLLTLPAVGFLMYAYMKKGQGLRHTVASTLILSQLKSRVAARRTFRPPPIFFLELLILLLMIVAISGLFKKEPARHIAILIDNSLGMAISQSDTARATLGSSVLQEAVREARSYLGGMRSDARIKVLATSPWMKPVSPRTLSPAEADFALSEVKQAYGQDRLEFNIRQLFASGKYDHVAVFTDKRLKQSEKGTGLDALERVSIFSVGGRSQLSQERRTDLQNIAVISAEMKRSDAAGDRMTVTATATAFSTGAAEVTLQLREYSIISTGGDFLPIQTVSKTLEPGKPGKFVFTDVQAVNPLHVRIVSNDQSRSRNNRIALDDHIWVAPDSTTAEPLVISDGSLKALGLEQLKSQPFKLVSPHEYEALAGANDHIVKNAPMNIFYKYSPTKFPGSDSLFVLPPANSTFFQSTEVVTRAEVTRWLRSHPVTTYLNLPALSIPALQPLVVPPWGNDLISTTRGSAAYLGEKDGKRIVVLGFEIFPYEAGEAPVISIFTLNILKWLNAETRSSHLIPLGSPVPEPELQTAELFTHTGLVSLRQQLDSGKITPDQPGLLRYLAAGGEQKTAAVIFYDERESNTLEPGYLTLGSLPQGEAPAGADIERFGPLLAKLLVLLLLAHLIFLCIQPTRQPIGASR